MTEASATRAKHSARPPGFARVASVAGIPIYLHWSCLLGGVVLAATRSFDQQLLLPLILGYLLVILIHEAGHAVAARSLGPKVFSIRLRGLGGVCITEPIPGARATLVVFSAGLVAQLALFAAVLVARQLWDKPEGPKLAGFIYALTFGNALAFAWSLIPMTSRAGQPTDGRVLLQLALDRFHGRTVLGGTLPSMNSAAHSPVFTPETTLITIAELVPPGFQQGVEILNDCHTPLDFIVDVLMRHLGSDGRLAIKQAVEIHNRGGLLMPLSSVGEAERIAAAVAIDAEAAGGRFVCRAVSLVSFRPGSGVRRMPATTSHSPTSALRKPGSMNYLLKLIAALGLSFGTGAVGAAGNSKPSEQAVIVQFRYGSTDLSRLRALEDRLDSVIKASGVGEYDGHEIAVDGSNGVLYMYGPDADLLFGKVAPMKSTAFMAGAIVTRRYGPPSDSVRKVSETIGVQQK